MTAFSNKEKERLRDLEEQSEFGGLLGWILEDSFINYAITREAVTKAVHRQLGLSNRWMDFFLQLCTRFCKNKAPDIYVFPMVVPVEEKDRTQWSASVKGYFKRMQKEIPKTDKKKQGLQFNSLAIIL